jgi:hypothetical protein
MKPRRVKLLVAGILGSFVVASAGFLAAAKWGGFFDREESKDRSMAVFSGEMDSDEDGLLDREERELGTNLYNPDTDKDGYSDGEEVRLGFDPLKMQTDKNVDLDGDGLTGEDEKKYGTDPKLADSDFDGYSDGEEIAAGHDPLSANLSDLTAFKAAANVENEGSGQGGEEGVVEVSNSDRQQIGFLEGAFSASDIQSFQDNMTNYITSQSGTETVASEVRFPEISDSDIKIGSNTGDDAVQSYVNSLGDIFYNNLNFQDSYDSYDLLSSSSGSGGNMMAQFSLAMANILEQTKDLEVPADERLVNVHKKIVAAFLKAGILIQQIEDSDLYGDEEAMVKLTNNFSELSYILKSKVVNEYLMEIDNLAHERSLQLPEYKFNF